MFAGKTSEILRTVRRYTCLGKPVLVLTADIDNRYQTDIGPAVVSHDRTAIPAHGVDIHGLLGVLDWPEFAAATAIVVDEAQFFVGCLVDFVRRAVDVYEKHVVVVGLDGDAEQRPFGDVLALIPRADSVEKKTALCLVCSDGTPAIMTQRLSVAPTTGPVAIGGADMYRPVCRRHISAA
jgi:thymidine kinase